MKIKNIFFYIFLFFLIFINYRCESPKQGCNDPAATNFAFDADEPCDQNLSSSTSSCPCVYPSLLFNFIPRFVISKNNKDSNVIWKNDLLISNQYNQDFYLKGFSFFISNIILEDNVGRKASTIDSILIPVKYNQSDSISIKIPKNIALFGQNTSSFSVGVFKEYGHFKKITFDIGLKQPALNANILNTNMPNYCLNTDSMYVAPNYTLLGGKFLIQQISPVDKLIELNISSVQSVSLTIPDDINFKIAENAVLNLRFDFQFLFSNIDLNSNQDIIENKILENFEKSLLIAQ